MSKETKEFLDTIKNKHESYDNLIERLIMKEKRITEESQVKTENDFEKTSKGRQLKRKKVIETTPIIINDHPLVKTFSNGKLDSNTYNNNLLIEKIDKDLKSLSKNNIGLEHLLLKFSNSRKYRSWNILISENKELCRVSLNEQLSIMKSQNIPSTTFDVFKKKIMCSEVFSTSHLNHLNSILGYYIRMKYDLKSLNGLKEICADPLKVENLILSVFKLKKMNIDFIKLSFDQGDSMTRITMSPISKGQGQLNQNSYFSVVFAIFEGKDTKESIMRVLSPHIEKLRNIKSQKFLTVDLAAFWSWSTRRCPYCKSSSCLNFFIFAFCSICDFN